MTSAGVSTFHVWLFCLSLLAVLQTPQSVHIVFQPFPSLPAPRGCFMVRNNTMPRASYLFGRPGAHCHQAFPKCCLLVYSHSYTHFSECSSYCASSSGVNHRAISFCADCSAHKRIPSAS